MRFGGAPTRREIRQAVIDVAVALVVAGLAGTVGIIVFTARDRIGPDPTEALSLDVSLEENPIYGMACEFQLALRWRDQVEPVYRLDLTFFSPEVDYVGRLENAVALFPENRGRSGRWVGAFAPRDTFGLVQVGQVWGAEIEARTELGRLIFATEISTEVQEQCPRTEFPIGRPSFSGDGTCGYNESSYTAPEDCGPPPTVPPSP